MAALSGVTFLIWAVSSALVRASKSDQKLPEPPTGLKVTLPENNVIKVKCEPPLHLNGPDTNYIVQLLNVSGSKQNKKSCDFEFKYLSYSTSYTVKVVTFNGHFKNAPVTKQAFSLYNKKGLIIGLVTLIIFISCVALGVSFFIRKRREFRNVGNEELMLNSKAIYTNMPPPKGNHKALR